jgi:tRNA pseudouridine38-40 synthase
MPNFKIILEYDGSDFAGWQFQPEQKTLQGELERAIKRTSGEKLRVTASGRTDAGVHALGQVVSFRTDAKLDARAWHGAFNQYLPHTMRAMSVEEVPEDFNARFSAKGKQYEYIVINRKTPSAIRRNYAWHVPYELDYDAMVEASKLFIGCIDFTSFSATDTDAVTFTRTLSRLDMERDGEQIRFTFVSAGFLRHMVRNIVGTLVDVGRGRIAPLDITVILEAKDRKMAGTNAPPQGLYLVKVEY